MGAIRLVFVVCVCGIVWVVGILGECFVCDVVGGVLGLLWPAVVFGLGKVVM